jgi:hypothetical protein
MHACVSFSPRVTWSRSLIVLKANHACQHNLYQVAIGVVVLEMHLRAILLTDADSTFAVETVGPEAVELNIALAHVGVDNQEPGTEDTLGKDIEHGVGDDLSVDADLASTIGDTPDTSIISACVD